MSGYYGIWKVSVIQALIGSAVLFAITKTWKKPNYTSTEEEISTHTHTHNYTAI